jgi:acyl carrier protein
MPSRDEVRDKIQIIFRDVFDEDDIVIHDQTVADDVPDWDSTNHVRLIVAIEEELDIRFESDEIAAPENVGELVDMVKSKLDARG